MRASTSGSNRPHANSLLGVRIWADGLERLIESSLAAIHGSESTRRPYVFACANPHSMTVAARDPAFKLALSEADAVVPDGVGMQIAANLCGRSFGQRVTGIDYFRGLMSALNQHGSARVAYFGSQTQVLDKLVARGRAAFPHVAVTTAISPPYGDWSPEANDRFIEQINMAKADVLWIGMTAPKQEKWVRENQGKLNCAVVGSIGAVFDYFAGTVRRAPEWMCGMGLEWAYRLSREPKRLWQRTFVSAPQFLGLAMGEALRGREH
jgi:N-acetylglucosaminyldiphosphoundecaprenol N-acetyl-beta-D-mannosaminyltransferase